MAKRRGKPKWEADQRKWQMENKITNAEVLMNTGRGTKAAKGAIIRVNKKRTNARLKRQGLKGVYE